MKTTSRGIAITMAALSLSAFGQAPNSGSETRPATGAAGGNAAEVSPSAARANLELLFKGLDTNGDGTISRDEFFNGSAAFAEWTQSHGKPHGKVSAGPTGTMIRDYRSPAPAGTTGSGGTGGAAGTQPAGGPGTSR